MVLLRIRLKIFELKILILLKAINNIVNFIGILKE